MSDGSNGEVDRRKLLKALGASSAAVGLAGCNNDSDSDTPADQTATPEPTPTPTDEPTETPNNDPTTPTPTPNDTAEVTEEPTPTMTPTPTATPTPTETPTPTPTQTPTATPTETPTPTQTPTATSTPTQTPSSETYENPLYEPHFPDPTILQADDGTYYAYGTNMDRLNTDEELLIPILKSDNLVDWEYVGEAFEERPGWTMGSLWAPDVELYNGTYYIYYSLRTRPWNDPNNPWGIGVATSDSPEGPFTDRSPNASDAIINDNQTNIGGLIDPYFFTDDGTPYMGFGSFNGLYYVEMNEDGLSRANDDFTQIAGDAYEGMILFKRNGYYYLIGSSGNCCIGYPSTYQYHVGRSENLEGPYTTPWGIDMMDINNTASEMPSLVSGPRFPGPAHGDIITYEDGSLWTIYHGYDSEDPAYLNGNAPTDNAAGDPPRRVLFLDRVAFDENDWPSIGNRGLASETAVAPGGNYEEKHSPKDVNVFQAEEGTYRLMNLNSGKALEIEDGSTEEGAIAQQWEYQEEESQHWELIKNDNNTARLKNVNSGMVLSADPESPEAQGGQYEFAQREWNEERAQEWKLIENVDGTVRFINRLNGFTTDVLELSTENGAPMIHWVYWGGDHQKWQLVEV